MPPKPPEILTAQERVDHHAQDASTTKKSTIEQPAELWRDFSRLTMAFETGQGTLASAPLLGNTNGNLFKPTVARRPQLENLSSMPKILPAVVSANKLAGIKRRSQNLSHLPVHSWLQFQFNKTMTNPGALGQSSASKKTNVLGFKPITIFQTTV
ncbi:hypothetical protein BGZ65_002564 [Modicella reniformis]|uniref:Uncharacterized protein n=1 Tax=Modicella reniformis TaxID=1440133 RepID=A0A9P6J102_9FUNG|nr:hypothetical protein BGZ65_002564 [Modicella reniformis]